jgi:hypothetical protein
VIRPAVAAVVKHNHTTSFSLICFLEEVQELRAEAHLLGGRNDINLWLGKSEYGSYGFETVLISISVRIVSFPVYVEGITVAIYALIPVMPECGSQSQPTYASSVGCTY